MPTSPTLADEATFVSGVNPDGTLAQYAFAAWKGDNPATYSSVLTTVAKWFGDSSGATGAGGGTILYYFDPVSAWSSAEKAAFVACLNLWAAIANVSFAETMDASAQSKITITRGSDGQARTTLAGPVPSGGQDVVGSNKPRQITGATISIDTSLEGYGPITAPTAGSFSAYGGYPWLVMMLEIGHALGLGRGGPYPVGTTPVPSLQYSAYDNRQYTITSHISPLDTSAAYYSQYDTPGTSWGTTVSGGTTWNQQPVTWMPADVMAIQLLYGAATSTPLSGNNVFGFNSNIAGPIAPFFDFNINTRPILTLWSSGVNNTLDARNFSQNATVNLNAGSFSSLAGLTNNIAIAQGTRIDRLYTGSGSDLVTGNNNGDYIDTGAGNDTIAAGSGEDTLVGGGGNDSLSGGSSVDVAVFSGSRAAYAITQTSIGNFTLSGPDGTDTLTGIEYAKFDDQKFRLLPGEGVVVDFNADPATYMRPIRDFDGNDLAGQGTQKTDPSTGRLVAGDPWDGAAGWKLAGVTDINRSGLSSHILFNRQIGRWAEVTTQADGKVYWRNHGWAGDTRIVGIYIDPLVQSGVVVAGSDVDSQRRFQNDLFIDNIKSVVTADDFDHDGYQEIYFNLTDGTAYLHAYMHADGNIRYANYQNSQQVQDYLSSNGYGAATWSSWLAPTPMMAATEAPMDQDLISPQPGTLAAVSG